MNSTIEYNKAGVSIERGEELVARIAQDNPAIGGFAGLYKLDNERSLVACTDGVGTKLEISIAMEAYESLGQDLVAMSVNDLVVCGARPLFFLDYYATGKLDVDVAHRVIRGISSACERVGCVLLGGETAEMPGFYEGNKFDLAGFAVGEVANSDIIDGTRVVAGDVIVGLPSSGFHANGYSLVRKIIRDRKLNLTSNFETGKSLGDALCLPTALYVNDVKTAQRTVNVKAMAHITGGGLSNIGRSLPKHLTYHIDRGAIRKPAIIEFFQDAGKVTDNEAYTVWNMGLGFVLIVSPQDATTLISTLPHAFLAGSIK